MDQREELVHPVQTKRGGGHPRGQVPQVVSRRAYEVYVALYGAQEALVTGGCRGGFGAGELVAFLYARSFPRPEWDVRFKEALAGMKGL